MKTKKFYTHLGCLVGALISFYAVNPLLAADTSRPVLTIVAPTAGQRITTAPADVLVRGRARDDVQVTSVQIQLNGGAWLPAATGNGYSNWTATVSPQAGTNRVRAYAVDSSGNKSRTNSVTFDYVVLSTLLLITNGDGGISRNFEGLTLEVGHSYTVTAVPGPGQIFAGWDGSVVSTSPVLHFTMIPDMNLDAHFVPNPFPPAVGVYNGLFGEMPRSQQHSGFVRLSVARRGAYSAFLQRGTNIFPFSGQFSAAGNSSNNVNGWTVLLTLDLAGAEQISGTVNGGDWIADLLAKRAVFDINTNRATQFRGKYTLIVPGKGTPETSPVGDGYAAVTVSPGGSLSMSGTLADATPWSQQLELPRDGNWPCYVPLYHGRGSIGGWLIFNTNVPSQEINGTLNWIRPPRDGARFYPLGFTNEVLAVGSRYTAPTNTNTRVIDVTNAVVVFDGGNLSGPFTNNVRLLRNNVITNKSPNNLTMSINVQNGLFVGSVVPPGTDHTNSFKGALLQDLDAGYGFFLGTDQSGSVFFGSP
jgi:hypothetical protein